MEGERRGRGQARGEGEDAPLYAQLETSRTRAKSSGSGRVKRNSAVPITMHDTPPVNMPRVIIEKHGQSSNNAQIAAVAAEARMGMNEMKLVLTRFSSFASALCSILFGTSWR